MAKVETEVDRLLALPPGEFTAARNELARRLCIGVFAVRGGRIAAVREYMDTLYEKETAFGDAVERRGTPGPEVRLTEPPDT